ncbi:MAG: beta-N-acetylhexosaminidase, partial [Bacteroides sp.]
MKHCRTIFMALLFGFLAWDASGQKPVLNLIPQPSQVDWRQGSFSLSQKTRLYTNLTGEQREHLLVLLKGSALDLPQTKKERKEQTISLLLVKPSDAYPTEESYTLSVTTSKITIAAPTETGLFYGVQSLLQLIRLAETPSVVPAMEISDTPRFAYRGMHLDVSRHFRSKEFVMKQLDAMASYKLNRFHWHLTDGAGWRIEIKKYPLLTDVAAWRPYESWKEWWKGGSKYCSKDDPKAQGGYYTQEDIKEVVAYAAARHITVIPEIEMPGHSEEVLAVYPELSCAEKPYVNSDFCIGNEQTFTFLQDVLTEVMALFPSQ